MAASVASDTDQETTKRCPYVGMSPACWHRYIGTAVRVAMLRFSSVLYTKRCLHADRPRRRWHKDCFACWCIRREAPRCPETRDSWSDVMQDAASAYGSYSGRPVG